MPETMTVEKLSGEEKMVLRWLWKEDSSAYGECHGYALNTLLNTGLATSNETPPSDYARISLTDAGWAILKQLPPERGYAGDVIQFKAPPAEDLKCPGVGRDAENDKALVFYLSRKVTDEEMRFLHDVMQRAVIMAPTV